MPKSLKPRSDENGGALIVREYFDTPRLGVQLIEALIEARKNKRNTYNEWKFEKYAILYIWDLYYEIDNRAYRPGSSRAFIIEQPVVREIFAANFRDRLVHHLLFSLTAEWWDRHFIYNSFSCRKGKGTLLGIRQLYRALGKASGNFKRTVWVLQLDLLGYFMSLPRRELYDRAVWGLGQQFPPDSLEYNMCHYLWKVIIFDEPTKEVRIKGSRDDWNALPKSKSLFHAPEGCGIVIGNLTSQLLSNVYLDMLDRYVKHELGYKYYGRYVDDFWLLGEREQLKEDKVKIQEYLTSIGLTMHPKKIHLQPAERGIAFLGAVVYPHRILPGKRIKAGFNRAAADLVADRDGAWESFQSYIGLSKHFRSAKMQERALRYTGLDGTAN
jgi:hypothetical protein